MAILAVLAALVEGVNLESSLACGTFVHCWGGDGAADQKSERKNDLGKVSAKDGGRPWGTNLQDCCDMHD